LVAFEMFLLTDLTVNSYLN